MSNTLREIITLQVGHYANFIGAHWWNLQEASFNYESSAETDINHDFLFREGVTPNRIQTYTPRLLAIDAKGSLNNLSSCGTLYEAARTPSPLEASWGGDVQLVQQLQSKKNEFLKDLEKDDTRYLHSIDEDKDVCTDDFNDQSRGDICSMSPQKQYKIKKDVKVWSDYLHTHLHPKSVYMLSDLWHQEAEGELYWGYLPGRAIINKETNQEEIFDRIRLFAESCGSLQGFQILTDGHNGMAGVTSGIVQHLADEFSSKDHISFPVTPPHFSASNVAVSSHYLTSVIQCYTELSSLTNLVIPLNIKQHAWSTWSSLVQFPHLKLDYSSAYETSAIFATFLDTISLAYRHRHLPLPLSHLVELLTVGGRQVATGSLLFPVGMSHDDNLSSWLNNNNRRNNITSITGGCETYTSPISECHIIRGLSHKVSRNTAATAPDCRFNSIIDLYEQHLGKVHSPATRYIASVKDPIKTGKTFPSIFTQDVDDRGYIDDSKTSREVYYAPSIGGLHQGPEVGAFLHKLMSSGSELNISRLPLLLEDGIDAETWADQMDEFKTLVQKYEIKSPILEESDNDD